MRSGAVALGIHRDRGDTHLATGSQNTYGYFASIRDKNFHWEVGFYRNLERSQTIDAGGKVAQILPDDMGRANSLRAA